jgi:hypothetical protein
LAKWRIDGMMAADLRDLRSLTNICIFLAMAPASADAHDDRFKRECKSGLRKC